MKTFEDVKQIKVGVTTKLNKPNVVAEEVFDLIPFSKLMA